MECVGGEGSVGVMMDLQGWGGDVEGMRWSQTWVLTGVVLKKRGRAFDLV